MIDPGLLGDLAKDHQKNKLNREDARAFLKELMALCAKYGILLQTSNQILRFSKSFGNSNMKTVLKAIVDRDGKCPAAKIEFK